MGVLESFQDTINCPLSSSINYPGYQPYGRIGIKKAQSAKDWAFYCQLDIRLYTQIGQITDQSNKFGRIYSLEVTGWKSF
jgi:hypothetical protein